MVHQINKGNYVVGGSWPKFSEEWYWHMLLTTPFRSVFEDAPNSRQPLIATITKNLSQTPREQCELKGIVTEGLDREGPGQEVELCGLQGRPELNGRRGRVLPSSGRGAPPAAPAAGRVAVRLAPQGAQAPEVIAVKTTNLRSPHASTAAGRATGSAAAAAAPGSTSRRQQQQPSASRQRILQLLKDEFELWETGATIDTRNLKKAGLKQHMIRCGACRTGGEDVPEYVALKRDAHFGLTPVAHEAVQLRCLDCFAALAGRAGMPLTAEGAEAFCSEYMMGAMEMCWTIY